MKTTHHFVLVRQAYAHKNKLQKAVCEHMISKDKTLISNLDPHVIYKCYFQEVEEINKKHPRCKRLVLNYRGLEDGVYMLDIEDVIILNLHEVKKRW